MAITDNNCFLARVVIEKFFSNLDYKFKANNGFSLMVNWIPFRKLDKCAVNA